jgi:hypothetical protein
MHDSAWIALLRTIPQALHDNLVLVTRIGQEFTVRNIFRMEEDFVVIRGRMSGTVDAGRVFVIPYTELHFVGFQKPLKEKDVAAIFGGQFTGTQTAGEGEVAAVAADPTLEPVQPAPVEPVAAPEPTPLPSPAPEIETKPKPAAKGLLLERVRARLAASGQTRSGGPS